MGSVVVVTEPPLPLEAAETPAALLSSAEPPHADAHRIAGNHHRLAQCMNPPSRFDDAPAALAPPLNAT
jgi:hypothetical protein